MKQKITSPGHAHGHRIEMNLRTDITTRPVLELRVEGFEDASQPGRLSMAAVDDLMRSLREMKRRMREENQRLAGVAPTAGARE